MKQRTRTREAPTLRRVAQKVCNGDSQRRAIRKLWVGLRRVKSLINLRILARYVCFPHALCATMHGREHEIEQSKAPELDHYSMWRILGHSNKHPETEA